jgi:hypothetical protein
VSKLLGFWNSYLRFPRWVAYFIWLSYFTSLGIVHIEGAFRSGEYRWVWEILQDIKHFTLFVVFASLFFPLGVLTWKGNAYVKKNALWLLLSLIPAAILVLRIFEIL